MAAHSQKQQQQSRKRNPTTSLLKRACQFDLIFLVSIVYVFLNFLNDWFNTAIIGLLCCLFYTARFLSFYFMFNNFSDLRAFFLLQIYLFILRFSLLFFIYFKKILMNSHWRNDEESQGGSFSGILRFQYGNLVPSFRWSNLNCTCNDWINEFTNPGFGYFRSLQTMGAHQMQHRVYRRQEMQREVSKKVVIWIKSPWRRIRPSWCILRGATMDITIQVCLSQQIK